MKLLLLLVLTGACSIHPGVLNEKAKELEVYSIKPVGCNVVGKVIGMDNNGSTELATNHALNQAEKLNASGILNKKVG